MISTGKLLCVTFSQVLLNRAISENMVLSDALLLAHLLRQKQVRGFKAVEKSRAVDFCHQ